MFKKKKQQQAWRKVSDLKEGMPIAVPDDNGGVLWDEIESIKPVGREQVYDIEVEGAHNFVGNDIFAHNTYIGTADVVALDEAGAIKKATAEDNAAGVMLELEDSGTKGLYKVTGRLQVKVTEENGPVRAGDKLTISELLPGHAMKMTESGNSIGIALENSTEGTDNILVFVNLGYQKIQVAQNAQGQLVVDGGYDFEGQHLFGVKSIASLSGKWAIAEDGTITAAKVVADEIETKKLKIAGAETSTVGREQIAVNSDQITVNNDNITENSTILITFRGDYAGRYWIESQETGKFTLKLSSPVAADVSFDYWVVETDLTVSSKQEAESSDQTGSGGEEIASPSVESEPKEDAGLANTGEGEGNEEPVAVEEPEVVEEVPAEEIIGE